jgi:lysophospholipase L1-like esterase
MPRSIWEGGLVLLVVGFPWLLARYRGRRDLAALVVFAALIYASAFVMVVPARDGLEQAVPFCGLLALDLCAWFAPLSLERRLLATARSRPAKVVLACLGASLVPLAVCESICRVLTDCHVLTFHHGIQTVWRAGHDDWRLATITGDENREPDPVLLWRPVARKPYSSQRFKGPQVAVPKPPDVVRLICYGDSLTDGPPKGGWPAWLQSLLAKQQPGPGRRFEVLNAGVAGYSSHQGLLRFLQEVDLYDPDLILVSFGWNDAAEAIGQPDKSFRLPAWPLIVTQRALVHYRAYLVLMHYTLRWRTEPPAARSGPVQPRVSVGEYLANLERFRSEAVARGIPIVFLTRPHKLPPEELAKNPTWRGSVPRYNAALVAWAKKQNLNLLDVQRYFELLPPSFFSDECHFTRQGYQRMGELVRDQLVNRTDGILGAAVAVAKNATAPGPFQGGIPVIALKNQACTRR